LPLWLSYIALTMKTPELTEEEGLARACAELLVYDKTIIICIEGILHICETTWG